MGQGGRLTRVKKMPGTGIRQWVWGLLCLTESLSQGDSMHFDVATGLSVRERLLDLDLDLETNFLC